MWTDDREHGERERARAASRGRRAAERSPRRRRPPRPTATGRRPAGRGRAPTSPEYASPRTKLTTRAADEREDAGRRADQREAQPRRVQHVRRRRSPRRGPRRVSGADEMSESDDAVAATSVDANRIRVGQARLVALAERRGAAQRDHVQALQRERNGRRLERASSGAGQIATPPPRLPLRWRREQEREQRDARRERAVQREAPGERDEAVRVRERDEDARGPRRAPSA